MFIIITDATISAEILSFQKQLTAIANGQTAQTALLMAIQAQGVKIMATVAQVQADVTAEDTVIDSAVTLLQGLSAALTAAGTDPAALDALKADIDAKTATLAAAVVANTPGAPSPAAAAQQAQAAVAKP